jgi:hypothetical protein
MNHNPSDNSSNVPPSGQAVVIDKTSASEPRQSDLLDPSIQQALGCLDIKLEDELTRFRSHQQERSQTTQSAQINATTWEQSSADFGTGSEILTAEIVRSAISPSHLEEDLDPSPSSGFIIIDGLTTTTSSGNRITTVDYVQMSARHEDMSENLDLNFSSGGEIAPFHDEYLSSSQELLRQIQSGYPASSDSFSTHSQPAPPAAKPKYLTPIKIGSMAAACVLVGGTVYTALNPDILAPLIATKTVTVTAAATNSLGQSIQSPNLAANEFTDLSLSNLNTIKLPTATTTIGTAITPTVNAATTAAATTPMAIPFNGIGTAISPTATITSQPRLADSLVRSLLPPNFHSFAKQSGYRSIQPGMRR